MTREEPQRILIRFNTKWQEDSEKRQWRVLVNGEESLASEVHLHAKARTVEEAINGEPKFHFLCIGTVQWWGEVASIHPIEGPDCFRA